MPQTTPPTDVQKISEDFTRYYMQRATEEFAEDLDAIRTADDFQDSALPILVHALQQGTSIFSIEDKRRVVTGGTSKINKEK
jgi:ribosome assembly protein 3